MSVAMPVIVVNSLVARGSVGGRADLAVLGRLGFPVTFVPTVLLPWHPGHGPGTRVVVDPALAADLAARPETAAGCLTGYFGDAAQVAAAERLVAGLRAGGGRPLFLCDPVLGDAGRFYVPEPVRDALRRLALTADIVTPNRFELAVLAGVDPGDLVDNAGLLAAARALGRPEVVVTSAFAPPGAIANLLVTADGAARVTHPAVPRAPHGTGDLLAALYLAWRLRGTAPQAALATAAGITFRLVAMADGGDELPLAEGGELFASTAHALPVEPLGHG
jgi:pyridoxine kinase